MAHLLFKLPTILHTNIPTIQPTITLTHLPTKSPTRLPTAIYLLPGQDAHWDPKTEFCDPTGSNCSVAYAPFTILPLCVLAQGFAPRPPPVARPWINATVAVLWPGPPPSVIIVESLHWLRFPTNGRADAILRRGVLLLLSFLPGTGVADPSSFPIDESGPGGLNKDAISH